MKFLFNAGMVAVAVLFARSVEAQTVTNAADNAGNYSSWPQAANNGSGFGSWSYNNTTPNGGFSGQFLGGSPNINSGSGNAFGFYANNGASAMSSAILPFSGGSLTAGQTFSIQMQNGNITDNGGRVGFSLQNNSAVDLFQFYFNGGSSDYYINVSGTQVDTGAGFTSGPMTLQFSQGAGNAWAFSLFQGNTLTAALSSVSTGDSLANNNISRVDLFSLNGGSSRTLGDNANLYFNNVMITTVPEPTSVALAASGLALLYVIRRRR